MQNTLSIWRRKFLILTSILVTAFSLVIGTLSTLAAPIAQAQETGTPVAQPEVTSQPPLVDPVTTPETTPAPPQSNTLTQTPTLTATVNLSVTSTPFSQVTPGIVMTETATVMATTEPTATVTPTPTIGTVYLPIVFSPLPFVPVSKALFCSQLASQVAIPDDSPDGVSNQIVINDSRRIADMELFLDVAHTWVGDLSVRLSHNESGKSILLIDQPGVPASELGCGNNNIKTILDDEMSSTTENKCASSPAAVAGSFIPQQGFGVFDGQMLNGTWTLTVADLSQHDTGSLRSWCLLGTVSENPAPLPPPPVFTGLPGQRIINGVTGQHQEHRLSCEIRSAVDWAGVFGKSLTESQFLNNLPFSTNPDKGFVGDLDGLWGQVPPNDYGVHAEPIAARLRHYGLEAYAHRPFSWDGIRAEIAAGRPVIVWIIGIPSVANHLGEGSPRYFTPPDGLHTIVAPYEHTVVITGYTASRVYYLNGPTVYNIPITEFLDSWSALGNMAVTASP